MGFNETLGVSLAVSTVGVLAFIFGVIAENKKLASGTAIPGKDVIICKYPHDYTIALGSLSVVCIFLSTILGALSLFYPYKGKTIPTSYLFQSTTLKVYFAIAMVVSVFGEAIMIWATVTEGLHRSRNVHHDLDYQCPTAKTGLFGGAGFVALDATLFWLICLMLTMNARADYFEEEKEGQYGQVLATDPF